MRRDFLVLLAVLIPGLLPLPASVQETGAPDVKEAIKTLKKAEHPSFKSRIHVSSDHIKDETDQFAQTIVTYDGTSTLHTNWLQLFYDTDQTLVMRNRQVLQTSDVKQYHRWWIRGKASAFVDRGRASLSDMIQIKNTNIRERVRMLWLVLYQVQLFPETLDKENVSLSKSGTEYRVRLPVNSDNRNENVLKLTIDRDRYRISQIQFEKKRPPSFYRPKNIRISLRIESHDGSNLLPRKASFTDEQGVKHRVSFRNKRSSGQSSFNPDPVWFAPENKPSDRSKDACQTDLFRMTQAASFYDEYQFQKRLNVHKTQLDRIESCFRKAARPHITERELHQAITFSTDRSFTPSWTSSKSIKPTSFMVLLRLIQLVDEGELTPEKTGSISLPPIYSVAVQLLAFRSSIRSIDRAKQFTRQLNRITEGFDIRGKKMFVHELELRLRGRGDQKGLVQEEGKQFLASIQKESESTFASTLLMARLYHKLGYFLKADKAYARLMNQDTMLPEVKTFIRSARTKARQSLNKLSLEELEPKEILYISGLNAENSKVDLLRSNFNSFLNMYEQSEDTPLFLEDIYVLRSCLNVLLNHGHNDLVRSSLKELIRREKGDYLKRPYLRSIVEEAFGTSNSELYELIRLLPDTERVSLFMDLESAVEVCIKRVKNGTGDRTDYEFLARAVPNLLEDGEEVPKKWLKPLKRGSHSYPSSSVILERTGDLFWRTGDAEKSADAYQNALNAQHQLIEKKQNHSVQRDVPTYYPPYSDLSTDQPEPRIQQPLLLKYAFVSRRIDRRIDSASERIRTLADKVGRSSNWTPISRDPEISANYQLQYAGWALYYLGKTSTGIELLRKAVRHEHGRYPYGSFRDSATYGLSRLFLHKDKLENARNVLRTAAMHELNSPRTFRYEGSAGERYVQLLTKFDRWSKSIDYLKQATQVEMLRMTPFSYSDSATESLVNLLFERKRPGDAFRIMNVAFYRSLVEQPSFQAGTAPYEFVRKLKEHRHPLDALVVAREFSKVYPSDPKSLQKEIISLQNKVKNASQVQSFTSRFSEEPSDQTMRAVDQVLSDEDLKETRTPGDTFIERLAELRPGVISVLKQRKNEATSESRRQQLNELIRSVGRNVIRSLYQRPDFLKLHLLDE